MSSIWRWIKAMLALLVARAAGGSAPQLIANVTVGTAATYVGFDDIFNPTIGSISNTRVPGGPSASHRVRAIRSLTTGPDELSVVLEWPSGDPGQSYFTSIFIDTGSTEIQFDTADATSYNYNASTDEAGWTWGNAPAAPWDANDDGQVRRIRLVL